MSLLKPAIIAIGDEVLCGETKNSNTEFLIDLLGSRKIPASLCMVLPDELEVISGFLSDLLQKNYAPLLLTGGLGGTHDDYTRQAVADALGVECCIHDLCMKKLEERYLDQINDQRRRMAWLPRGCDLIENPLGAPGFLIGDILAFPGFPKMLQAMAPKSLDLWLEKKQCVGFEVLEACFNTTEGILALVVESFSRSHPQCRVGIYADAGMEKKVVLRLRYPSQMSQMVEIFSDFCHFLEKKYNILQIF